MIVCNKQNMMNNIDNVINELIEKLLAKGSAEFSQDGLNIKANTANGCVSISASYESPKKDETESQIAEQRVQQFEDYIQSLSDDFFLEVTESFKPGELKELQDMLDSLKADAVNKAIETFMLRAKLLANDKVDEISEEIDSKTKELQELIEIRDSYNHVCNKKF